MASVTSTYARAFADVVFDQRLDPAKTLQEAQSVAQLAAGSRELREVWEAPSIPAEQKRALLDAIVTRAGLSRPVRNFVAVLIDHRRIKFLDPIVKEFEHELNRRMGFVEAADHQRARVGPAGTERARVAGGEADRPQSARPLRPGWLNSRGRHREGRQHDLRRFGERPAGADKRSYQLLAFSF